MSNKFTPHADATATLGTIHTKNEARDAVHLAVYQVTLGEPVKAGSELVIQDGLAYKARKGEKSLGILDPFLVGTIKTDSKVWLILHPGMITSLRHVWEHSDFDTPLNELKRFNNEPTDTDLYNDAYNLIANKADELEISYEDLIEHAKSYLESGHYYTGGGEAEGFYLGEDFWDAFEKVTKINVPSDERGNFIYCSC